MSTLFISYSTKDKASCDIVFDELIQMGYTPPFRDDHPATGIPAGSKWESELYRKLRLCKALVVLVSPHWLESKWCFAELAYAKAQGKEIFPILVSKSTDVPATVADRQGIDIADPNFSKRLRRGLAEADLAPENDFPWPVPGIDECPYPGLASFEGHHAGIYCGREKEKQEISERLNQMADKGQPRLLFVVGASGSGKSSLVKAGLLPKLTKNHRSGWRIMPTFRWNNLQVAGRDWPEQLAMDVVGLWPSSMTDRPNWRTLRDRYSVTSKPTGNEGPASQPTDYEVAVAQAARNFIEDVKDLLYALGPPRKPLLFFIDQFEEVLSATDSDSANSFLSFLGKVTSSTQCPWRCIATVRTDFLAVIQAHPDLITWKDHTDIYSLPLIQPSQFYDIIRRPAEKVGITFESDALVDQIVKETGTNDALPLLAFTLRELYEQCGDDRHFTAREYFVSLGGVEGCLTKVADALFDQAADSHGSEQQVVQHKLLLAFSTHLVRINHHETGEEYVRRAAFWKDLHPDIRSLLQHFIDRRLIVSRLRDEADPKSERVIEVAHEALFRKWQKLASWLTDRRELLRWRADVERTRTVSGKKWAGLTRSQLAIAEEWPKQWRLELTADELTWVKAAKKKVLFNWIALATTAVTFAIIALLAGWEWHLATDLASANGNMVTDLKKAVNEKDTARKSAILETARALEAQGQQHEEDGFIMSAMSVYSQAVEQHEKIASSDVTGRIRLGVLENRVPVLKHNIQCNGELRKIQWAIDGRHIFVFMDEIAVPGGFFYNKVDLYDLASERNLLTMKHGFPIELSPNGQYFLDGLNVRECATGDSFLRLAGEASEPQFAPDGVTIVAESGEVLRLWDFPTGTVRAEIRPEQGRIMDYRFSPDGKSIAIAGWDGVSLWAYDVLQLKHKWPISGCKEIRFSSDGKRITTTYDGAIDKISYVLFTEDEMGVQKFEGSVRLTFLNNDLAFNQRFVGYDFLGVEPRHMGNVFADSEEEREKYSSWELSGLLVGVGLQGDLAIHHDGVLSIMDAAGRRVRSNISENDLRGMEFSADGGTVLTAGGGVTANMWSSANGKLICRLEGHSSSVVCASFGPSGMIATASDDGNVRVWREAESSPKRLVGHDGSVRYAKFINDTDLVTASTRQIGEGKMLNKTDGKVIVWDLLKGTPRVTVEDDFREADSPESDSAGATFQAALGRLLKGSAPALEVVADATNQRAYCNYGDVPFRLKVLDCSNGDVICVLDDATILGVAEQSSSFVTQSIGNDKRISVWDCRTGKHLRDLDGIFVRGWYDVATLSDLIVTYDDKASSLHGWSISTGICVSSIKIPATSNLTITLNGNSSVAALGIGYGGEGLLCDFGTGKIIGRCALHYSTEGSPAFSPDGRFVSSFARDAGVTCVVDVSSARTISEIPGKFVSYCPDGSVVLTNRSGALYITQCVSGDTIKILRRVNDQVTCAKFTEDGRLLVVGYKSGILEVWDPVAKLYVAKLGLLDGPVHCLAINKAMNSIAACSDLGEVRVFTLKASEVPTGNDVAYLRDSFGVAPRTSSP